MNERQKIGEAVYFLGRMQAMTSDPSAFKHEFSAFMSAARSVLQYALDEAKTKSGGQHWFDDTVATKTLIKLFKVKRDTNVHEKPVRPKTTTSSSLQAPLPLGQAVGVQIVKADGATGPVETSTERESPSDNPTCSTSYSYTFNDWAGTEDVPTLCEAYLNDIREAVADGASKGFITP